MATKRIAKHKTREGWLMAAVPLLVKLLKPHKDFDGVAKLKASCGWPKYATSRAIGQCFSTTCSKDGFSEMFISPKLVDQTLVLSTLLHECIHAVVGIREGHRGEFKRVARAVGLEGKLTATFAKEDTPLWKALQDISERLGAYPHSALNFAMHPRRAWEKREMYYSPKMGPEYRAYMIQSQAKEYGPPHDPFGDKMVLGATWTG